MVGEHWDELRHHGDVEAEEGLLDFAVNVRGDRPPHWLRERLAAALDRLGRYPSAADDLAARTAAAHRHGRRPDEVLVLAGAAEGFALLPALRPLLAVVICPGFTEPEAALREAGVAVRLVFTQEADGHRLRPDAVPTEADLVVVGNPTNPTAVLHPATDIAQLARPGRVIVVDEAFADSVAGEPESLAGRADLPGLLVLRSLTKTWALAGLRAGYALGRPELLRRLAAPRPPWPVSTPALAAVAACSQPAAVAQAEAAAAETAGHREWQAAALGALPQVNVLPGGSAPYLLLRLPAGSGPSARTALRASGIAVRRGDTFPGLTPDHLRVAVRRPDEAQRLVDALRAALASVAATA